MQFSRLLKFLFVFNIISIILVNGLIEVQFVKDYFKEKMIRYGTIIGCFSHKDYFAFTKSLAFGNEMVAIININKIKATKDKLWFLEETKSHIGVILDGDCDEKNLKSFLVQCGWNNYFNGKIHWLIVTTNSNFSTNFKDVQLFINADINIMYPKGDTNFYVIEDVYNPASTKGGDLKSIYMGQYSRTLGFRIKQEKYKYWMRKNMSGVTLRTTIVLPVDFEGTLMDYLRNEEYPEINTFNRFHYKLISSCVNYYNFTQREFYYTDPFLMETHCIGNNKHTTGQQIFHNLFEKINLFKNSFVNSVVSREKSWGYLKSDGTFDGMAGQLERKLIDYGSSPLFYRVDRSKILDFARQTWTLRAAFIFRDQRTINWVEVFLKPFTTSVWLCLLFIFVLTIVFLKFASIKEKRSIRVDAEINWSYLLLNTLGVFCQQGFDVVPLFVSGRVTLFFVFICSLLVYQFYSASIVSSLLTEPNTKIKSIEDMLHSTLKVGCEDTLYTKDFLRYTTNKPIQDLYLTKILGKGNTSNFLPANDGLAMVKDGGYAFHVEVATAYPIITKTFSEQTINELREVQMYMSQPMYFNLQKNSPFKDMFNTCLQRLAEYGILNREIRFWHPKKPEGVHSLFVLTSLSLEYFYPLLSMLLIGILISTVILVLEIAWDFRQRARETRVVVPILQFIH